MDELDNESLPAGAHELSSDVAERVRSVISAAEAAANAVRHEAEQSAQRRRRIAEDEALRIIEDAKADADAYLEERRKRISELSDSVVERAEKIVARLDRAEEVRRQLQSLADSLGETAEDLAVQLREQTPPEVRASSVETPPSESEVVQLSEAAPVEEAPPAAAEPEADVEAVEGYPVETEPDAPPVTFTEPPEAEVVEPPSAEAPDADTAEVSDSPTGEERREPDDQLSARLVALQMAVAGGNRGDVEAHLRATFGISDPAPILDDVFGPGSDTEKRVAWPRTGDSAA